MADLILHHFAISPFPEKIRPAPGIKGPVVGELLRLTIDDVAIRRVDPLAGEVVVHFPRIGYRVEAA